MPMWIPDQHLSVAWSPRIRLQLLILAAVGMALIAGGCRRGPSRAAQSSPPDQPQTITLDYRYGWYHPADGKQTLREIAEYYQRDVELVARLNRVSGAGMPEAGMMIYIPPVNDPARVREALEVARHNPGILPHKPWDPKRGPATLKTEVKSIPGDQPLKTVLSERPIVETPGKQSAPPSVMVAQAESQEPPLRRSDAEASLLEDAMSRSKSAPARKKASSTTAGSGSRFEWPVEGEVVTRFKEGWRQACHGIEIGAPIGQTVRAARAGKVLLAQAFPGYGNLVLIDHSDGYATVYAYTKTMLVKENARVAAGDPIATVGSRHRGGDGLLFFQIRRNATPVDPLDLLQ